MLAPCIVTGRRDVCRVSVHNVVHNAVEGLCKRVLILCAERKMLGILRKIKFTYRASSWANAIHRL